MLKGIRTVVYHAHDIDKAKKWYADFTGVQPYFDEPFYVGFQINGFELGIDPDMTLIESGNHSCAYWSVDNLERAVTKALALGAELIFPIAHVGGNIQTATLSDPFGNFIGLICES